MKKRCRTMSIPQLIALILLSNALTSLAQAETTPKNLPLKLQKVSSGFNQITDIQFFPSSNGEAVVLEKSGSAWVLNIATGTKTKLIDLKVAAQSELGLLGFAFHPKFPSTKKVFVHYNPRSDLSRISEWTWFEPKDKNSASLTQERVILEVEQPYKNHNGGSLVFGPDGLLYVGLGDGGFRDDPQNRAQNLNTLLGKMLRIDVDKRDQGLEYAIPRDNPFITVQHKKSKIRPEIFAYGLRNPWKYSFDDKGRLIAGDVGQNAWEEITFIPKGANLGWRVYEASHCFNPPSDCEKIAKNITSPIAEYGRDMGASITGGHQYSGSKLTSLKGRYFFGDFVTGAIWSIALPQKESTKVMSVKDFASHGKFDVTISTFAKDAAGDLYIADFSSGTIYRLTE